MSAFSSSHPLFSPTLPTKPGRPHFWSNLNGCADSLALANAVRNNNNLFVVVTRDNHTALRLEHEVRFFLGDESAVLQFPDWETLPYDLYSPLPEIVSDRLRTLSKLPQIKQGLLIVSVSTLLQKLSPRTHILAHTFTVKIGEQLNIDLTRQKLEQGGYQNVSQVFQHGEFAVRGSIIDLFPMGHSTPYRIELFDDEVESIRTFNPESQRSLEKTDSIELFPAREFPFDEAAIKQFRPAFRNAFPGKESSVIYKEVSKELAPSGIEYYFPLFVEQTESLFSYFPDTTTLIFSGEETITTALHFHQEVESRYEERRHDSDRPILPPQQLWLSPSELDEQIKRFKLVQITADSEQKSGTSYRARQLPELSLQSKHKEPAEQLQQFLDQFDGKTLLISETAGHREALIETLKPFQLRPITINTWDDFLESDHALSILVAPMDHGIWLDKPAIAIITETQLAGEKVQQRRRRRKSSKHELENIINNLSDLEMGVAVVHRDHGVGRYLGLKKMSVGEIETEFLTLEYANEDKLYVPVSSLHLIGRFNGASPENAPLHKLGSGQWQKARRKAMERVRDVAAELLEVNAKRGARKGYTFKLDQTDYSNFAAAFPFEETPDQMTAIEQVVADMCSNKPMDRVICGDVGFGKTEVAMRATFVAVQSGKQVAIVAPTTLLAQQHFQNFRDRFADWPVRIESLSRFNTKKQQDQTIAALSEGKADIVIGTHKLFQKSIQYRGLGLVIIDEEHRFGVTQKEYFKKLRSEVDLLTLTATPIPRTLNMAMSGLRDISIIASPPPNRHTIQTFVSEWNSNEVREACLREIRRGGQIYFLHNNVESMPGMMSELEKVIPEARIEMAHGQMPEKALEQIMLDFYHQRFNLLLCSTIIESGIDVPSANTIIINRADKLGLAQLHQLRGRVGRSHHRAYAYLIRPPEKVLTKDAVKRLNAIESAGELGAGFTLSSHDMEIRGAGELLGDGQSGQIQEIGFTLYTELLERAVEAIRSGKQPELETAIDSGPEIELQLAAIIPDDYLPDVHSRLVLYKRIASAESSDELRTLQIEMIDRFGLLPDSAKNLFSVTEMKLKSAKLGIHKITASAVGGTLTFTEQPNINPEAIIGLIQKEAATYKLDGPEKLRFSCNLEENSDRIDFVSALLNRLTLQES
jgi:transcription-repair coupling factor (superfamily II helicase)